MAIKGSRLLLGIVGVVWVSNIQSRAGYAQITPIPSEVCQAIYKIENSQRFPYGIKSINTHGDKVYALKICENTVRNTFKRYKKAKTKQNFLDFLGDRFCPKAADKLGNLRWKRNIHILLDKH